MKTPVNILLVEDSVDDAALMLRALGRGGFDVLHERVASAAAMQAALARPGWDAVISDYNLPGFTGLDALAIHKASGLDLPFILVSGVIGEETAVQAMQRGAGDYVMKKHLALLAPALERGLKEATERAQARRAAQELRESEARFRSLTELSSDWYWEQDEEYRFVDFSGGENITGWDPDQRKALGLRRWELSGLMPVDETWDVHRALLDARKPFYNFEYQRVLGDGTRRYVAASGEPVFDANGRFTGYRGVATDITERKRAYDEHALLAAIVQSSNDAIISRDMDGIVQSWNPTAERMFGIPAAQAIGQPITLVVPHARSSELRPLIERVIGGETSATIESSHLRRDGIKLETSITFSAIRNAAGDVVAISSTHRDITEHRWLEQEAQRKAVLTQLLEALARAANEAASPEEAMRLCLERICEHGCWSLGRITYMADESSGTRPHHVVWHAPDRQRFAQFEQEYDAISPNNVHGRFVGRMLREQGAVWIADMSGMEAPRLMAATRNGLRCGFVFPVIVQGKVVAFLEFFADEVRAPDQQLLQSIGSVGAQLARLFEREEAATALKASEAWLRTVLEAEPESVSVIGADGDLIDMNRAGLDMLEAQSVEQVRELGVGSVVVAEHRARLTAHHEQTLAGKPSKLEFEVIGLRGTRRWMESHATPVDLPGAGGKAVLSVTRDITERKHAEEHVAYLSHYDALTGLPNRTLFADRLGLALARGKRQNEVVGIMLFNLDRFKYVNEGLGQEGGDELLRQVALRLKETLRDVDTIARLGGDEFAILAEDLSASADVNAVADKLLEAFALPFVVKGVEVVAVPSIGITIHPNGGDDPATLMEHAETAMQRVKREGGGGYRVYEAEPAQQGNQRLDTETRLRRAQERGELELHYQPKVDLLSGAITGVEALLRWNSPELGSISPARFIPIAEDSGLIVPIGDWVLRSACAQMRRWHELGHNIGIAVNLSPRQFRQKDLVRKVAQALEQSGLAPHFLELEITEGAAMSNAEQAIKVLGELHALGIRLSVDDFGTGYSSLSYLKRFPLDTLKIDRSFVMDLSSDANSDAIVRATIALAQSLHLKVVAEGVETEAQRDFLARADCNEMQGYLFSKPLPAAALLALLEKHAQAESAR